ncbi:hypothetical protein FE298_10645 [Salmonella enterica subsp. salamae serovar 47:z:e,n,x,z15]|nr:hypothetical protein [Salmonella enterica]ECF5833133.1 hypothetical protein [Salmonella enterica subsp. salamae]MBA2991528.1 hypothetical protein [Salmonella enterica subsp. salamae serovar 47:z:e,n,x,z15]ECF5994997.1 hypothetical protein [Salmonella enterica subsp. salamae]ECG1596861.1 hypothetical protein [Salmonella enterica subsp. salamae]
MAKLTDYQVNTLRAINEGKVMLRGKFDHYWWSDSDTLCSVVARRLKSKGLIKTVYLNSVRDKVELTEAGRQAVSKKEITVADAQRFEREF